MYRLLFSSISMYKIPLKMLRATWVSAMHRKYTICILGVYKFIVASMRLYVQIFRFWITVVYFWEKHYFSFVILEFFQPLCFGQLYEPINCHSDSDCRSMYFSIASAIVILTKLFIYFSEDVPKIVKEDCSSWCNLSKGMFPSKS